MFLSCLNDPTNHPVDDETIDKNLLSVFMRSHSNDTPGAPSPQTSKFPPTNLLMMEIPPTFREWKQSQQEQSQGYHITPPPFLHRQQLQTSSSSVGVINDKGDGGDIVVVTFMAQWDDELETSVIINDTLSSASTIEMAMHDGDVYADLGVSADAVQDYKFIIKKNGEGKMTFNWAKIKKVTVDTLMRFNNVDTDYVITLKCIVK